MDVKKRMDAGVGKECIASRCLRTQESLGFSDVELAFAVTSPYSAGLDTVRYCVNDLYSINDLHGRMIGRLQGRSNSAFVSPPYVYIYDNDLNVSSGAMLHNPAAARKAQEELDRVVGRGRLPAFADESSLPYVCAWLKELNRWHPVVPLAVPHSVTEDDVYEGFLIPKGATVFGNL